MPLLAALSLACAPEPEPTWVEVDRFYEVTAFTRAPWDPVAIEVIVVERLDSTGETREARTLIEPVVADAAGFTVPLVRWSDWGGWVPYGGWDLGEHAVIGYVQGPDVVDIRPPRPFWIEPYGDAADFSLSDLVGVVYAPDVEPFAPGPFISDATDEIAARLALRVSEGPRGGVVVETLWHRVAMGDWCALARVPAPPTASGRVVAGLPELPFQVHGIDAALEDVRLTLGLRPDGDDLGGVQLTALLDTRPLVPLLDPEGARDTICALLMESNGVQCRACPSDGAPLCAAIAVGAGHLVPTDLALPDVVPDCPLGEREVGDAVDVGCEFEGDICGASGALPLGMIGLVLSRRRRGANVEALAAPPGSSSALRAPRGSVVSRHGHAPCSIEGQTWRAVRTPR